MNADMELPYEGAKEMLLIVLSIKADSKFDKCLKYVMIYGVFFIGCFVMTMAGVFTSMAAITVTVALLHFCFVLVCVFHPGRYIVV